MGNGAELLSRVSMDIPCNRRIAVFSAAAPRTKILMHLLAGVSRPDSGRISRSVRVSFPIGNRAGFDAQLSGRQNVEHAARLYGADKRAVADLCSQICGLGEAFNKPISALSTEQRQRLSFVLAYCIPFDVYLHETDVTTHGARKKLGMELLSLMESRLSTAGLIIPSENLHDACEVCDTALILYRRALYLVDDVRDAALALNEIMLAAGEQPKSKTLKRVFGKGF